MLIGLLVLWMQYRKSGRRLLTRQCLQVVSGRDVMLPPNRHIGERGKGNFHFSTQYIELILN